MKFLFLIYMIFQFTSCSSYVDAWHKELDKDTNSHVASPRPYNKFELYRRKNKSNILTPLSTNSRKYLPPNVKRRYEPKENVRKRYKADDMKDNGSSGSLWSGDGKDSFLFTQDSRKRYGDIILINVFTKLKNDITAELKRAFPSIRKQGNKKGGAKKPQAPPVKDAANTGGSDSNKTAHDKISSIIIEEINKDHLLLSGRKSILFNNRKHLIEVQALVARRDVTVDDEVDSNTIIEHSITVLK